MPVEELIEACEVAEVQVRNALDLLAEELAPGRRGIVLKEVAGGYALATDPRPSSRRDGCWPGRRRRP